MGDKVPVQVPRVSTLFKRGAGVNQLDPEVCLPCAQPSRGTLNRFYLMNLVQQSECRALHQSGPALFALDAVLVCRLAGPG